MSRLLVTVGLAAATAGGVAFLVVGPGRSGPPPAAADPALAAVADLRPAAVRKVEVTPPGHPAVALTRGPDGSWSQPGNWPVRDGEAATLLAAVSGLRTRFLPIAYSDADAAKYGLAADQAAAAVVHTDDKTVRLTFGRPPAAKDESPFARPTYVRVDDLPAVLQVGPDVYPVVARPPAVYRRRQLFPDGERFKLTGGEPPADPGATRPPPRAAVLGDVYTSVTLEKPAAGGPAVTLKRVAPTPAPRRDPDRPGSEPAVAAADLARSWEVVADPSVRDRVDPAKLRAVLTAVPDLWVEKFVDKPPAEAGLTDDAKPEFVLTVGRADGRSVAVRFGKVSRTERRTEDPPPPSSPFAPPPPPPKVTVEEYRYAKLADNPLVFEVRADKLADLFAGPDGYRDPQVARFDTADVTAVTIARPGQPPLALTKKKGNKDADRADRWYVGDTLADATKVTDLLDALAKLEAKAAGDRLDAPPADKRKGLGVTPEAGTAVTLTIQPKAADGDPAVPPRTVELVVGKADADNKKVPVGVAGWPAVYLVDDAVRAAVDKPALAYRGRRLFDTAEAKLTRVAVTPKDGPAFALQADPASSDKKWSLVKPAAVDADPAKADRFADDLARAEVVEYVDEGPSDADLAGKYGLADPRFVVDLGFTGAAATDQALRVGAARADGGAYARRNGTGSVFVLPKAVVDALAAGPLPLLPSQLWSVGTDRVTAVDVRRDAGAETYRLAKDGFDWKLTGPFDAAVGYPDVQPLLAAVSAVKVDRYESLAPADAGKYGFDKPFLRLGVTYREPPAAGAAGDGPTVTKTLVIGGPTAAGAAARYARLDGPNPAVFVLPADLPQAADRPALGWLDKSILSVDPDKVTKVRVAAGGDGGVTLVKGADGGWAADGAAFPVDKPAVEALVRAAARPPVDRLAGYGTSVSWAAFGLDAPAAVVTLTTADGKGHALKVGKPAPDGGRFVRADDGPAAAVVSARTAEVLTRTRLDLTDRTLLAFDPAAATGLVRTKGNDTLELAKGDGGWEVVAPAKQPADPAVAADLFADLGRLRADKLAAFAPAAADLDKYGLANPVATVTVKLPASAGGDKRLALGGPADPAKPDGDRFAAAPPAPGQPPPAVGVIPGALANLLLAEPIKFRDRGLAKLPGVDKVTLERGDRKITFAQADGVWKISEPAPAAAAPVEAADLDAFAAAVADLRADELVSEKPADLALGTFGLATPEVRWTFAGRDGRPRTLLIGSKEKGLGPEAGRRVFAKLADGDLVGLLDPELSARVLAEYRRRAVWADVDASQADGLTVTAAGGNFVLQKRGGGWVDAARPDDPVDADKVTEVASAFANLKAERYASDGPPKAGLYGLADPSRVLVLGQKGARSRALRLGGPVGGTNGKQVYAQVDDPDRPEVFVLSEADTAVLTRDRPAFAGNK